jgi:uncharacterized protein (DUF305 family)
MPTEKELVADRDNQLYRDSMKRMMSADYLTTDCDFVRDMSVHHEIAVSMARDVYRHTNNPALLEFATGVVYSQEGEIALMREMQYSYPFQSRLLADKCSTPLDEQFQTLCQPDPDQTWGPYTETYSMPINRQSKVFHESMKRMERVYLKGVDKVSVYRDDALFLLDMIIHHQIAVEMCDAQIRHSNNPDLLELLRIIRWKQTKEIWRMKMMLRSYHRNLWLSCLPEVFQKMPSSKYRVYNPVRSSTYKLRSSNCLLGGT